MNNENVGILHNAKSPTSSGSKGFEEFIYLLSHDVRNSVRALVELPQWIEEDLKAEGQPISESLSENLRLMNTLTRRLDRMLIDLLVHSRVGRQQKVQLIDLEEEISQVLEQIHIPSKFQINCDIQCKTLHIGSRDIFTLFSALISNSVKHHGKDNGVIKISSHQEERECVITISDDGPGIAEKDQEHVFEVMTTLQPRDEVEGSGMGLAIIRKIVETYGGRLKWMAPVQAKGINLELRFQI